MIESLDMVAKERSERAIGLVTRKAFCELSLDIVKYLAPALSLMQLYYRSNH